MKENNYQFSPPPTFPPVTPPPPKNKTKINSSVSVSVSLERQTSLSCYLVKKDTQLD